MNLKWIRLRDQREYQGEDIGTWKHPGAAILLAEGYRLCDLDSVPSVADGYTRQSVTWVQNPDDAERGMPSVVDRLTSEIEADQVAANKARMIALMTPSLIQLAALYRSVLRRVTGDATAETNRSITRESVATIFLMAIENGTMTDELRDAQALLQFAFDVLSPIVGANPPNTWDLPWEVVP
jgi:hypothetical protein